MQDGPELYVCRLSEGRHDFANLDLVLDEYTEFTVEGAALHITGGCQLIMSGNIRNNTVTFWVSALNCGSDECYFALPDTNQKLAFIW